MTVTSPAHQLPVWTAHCSHSLQCSVWADSVRGEYPAYHMPNAGPTRAF